MAKGRKAKGRKATVTLRAVIARTNRKISGDGLRLRVARSATMRRDARYFLVDLKRNSIAPLTQDLAAYARKVGALHEWEEIE